MFLTEGNISQVAKNNAAPEMVTVAIKNTIPEKRRAPRIFFKFRSPNNK